MAAADTSLAHELGVSPELVESLRRNSLNEGEHWTRAEANRVVYTDSGFLAIRALLDLPPAHNGQKKETAPPEPIQAVIVRIHPNPQWVRVRVPDNTLHNVKVRSNKRLRVRVLLLCRLSQNNVWECCQPGLGMPSEQKEREADAHE